MITMKIEGLAEIQKMLGAAAKQAKFATAVSLTKTAVAIKDKLATDMAGGFQSASPWSVKSQFVKSAKPNDPVAIVGIKDQAPSNGTAPAKLLREHFTGGARGMKRFERALQFAGRLPNGYAAVPGRGLPTNKYGNPTARRVKEILDYLKKGGTHTYDEQVRTRTIDASTGKVLREESYSRRRQDIAYFVIPVGNTNPRSKHLAPGIWRRIGYGSDKAVVPVFLFVPRATYRKRFDLEGIARDKIRDFNATFLAEFQKALATAR